MGIITRINLCNTCNNRIDFPLCMPITIEFGDGVGKDNIVKCSKYREELSNMEYLTQEETFTMMKGV